jgi:Brp/Blh family beta-carotene 15,15'-monooxygenase
MPTTVRQSDRPTSVTVTGGLVRYSWLVLGLLTVEFALVGLADIAIPLWARAVVYLGFMIGVSLPHGGFEHVENLTGRGEGFQGRYLAAYVGLLGASLALFFVAPVVGLAVGLTVTVLKGGHGGLHVLKTVAGTDHLQSRRQRALAVFVRGGAVIAVPFVTHNGMFYMVAAYMVNVFEEGALASVDSLFGPQVQLLVGVTYGVAVLAHLGLGRWRAADPSNWRVDAFETLLLVAFFAAVPPIIAIGLYFPLWYATRQTSRLAGADGGRPLSAVDLRSSLRRFAKRAALPWLGSIALLGVAALAVPNPPTGPGMWVGFYSVCIAVIALPHVVVGSWLDRKQGIWSTAPGT